MPSSTLSTLSSDSSDEGSPLSGGFAAEIDKLGLTPEYENLIGQAIANPADLAPEQLEDIASSLCAKAFEKSINSYVVSAILITICDKDKSQTSTSTLISSCRQWFDDRAAKLRPAEGQSNSSPRKHRWSAFVAFATDFYLALKCKLRGVKLASSETDQSPEEANEDAETPSDEVHLEFADLLFDCCMDIVSILDKTNSPTTEIECLLGVLRSVGKHMEADRPQRMSELIQALKDNFVGPVSFRLPDNCLKSILELIEWAASGWQFNAHQVAYYYPSRS